MYYAVEDNDCCTRLCCGGMRSFDMKIFDNTKNEVIHLQRDFRCDSCWFPCCLQVNHVSHHKLIVHYLTFLIGIVSFLQELRVYSPPGRLIGTVEQTWSVCTPEFDIKNESGQCVLKIEGPICRYSICGNVEFKVGSEIL